MAAKKKAKPVSLRDRVCKTHAQWLERLILISERAITSHGNSIDEFFKGQAERLRKELQELKNDPRKKLP